MQKTGKKCLECSGDTVYVQVIDRGQKNLHYNFVYSNDDFKKKPRAYSIDGVIRAEMCELCGRIALRAHPNK